MLHTQPQAKGNFYLLCFSKTKKIPDLITDIPLYSETQAKNFAEFILADSTEYVSIEVLRIYDTVGRNNVSKPNK